MRHLYKVEVFARDYRYKDMALLSELNVQMDYLTLENTTLTVVDLAADKGDFVHVTDFYGVIIHQGIVLDVAREGNRAKLKVAPLLSLLDVQVQYDKAIFQAKPLEDCISKIITDTYISNADSLQNTSGHRGGAGEQHAGYHAGHQEQHPCVLGHYHKSAHSVRYCGAGKVRATEQKNIFYSGQSIGKDYAGGAAGQLFGA